jgi:hypothetical protein
MAARLEPGGHYNLNGGSLVGNALHDLNTVDSRNVEIDGLADVDRDVPTGDDLENDDDSASGGVCEPAALLFLHLCESFFLHYEFKSVIGFGAMFFLKRETVGLFTSVLSSILQLLHIIAKDREWCCDCCVSAAIW